MNTQSVIAFSIFFMKHPWNWFSRACRSRSSALLCSATPDCSRQYLLYIHFVLNRSLNIEECTSRFLEIMAFYLISPICMEKQYATLKIHMPVPHERTSISKILQILFPLYADKLVLGAFSSSWWISTLLYLDCFLRQDVCSSGAWKRWPCTIKTTLCVQIKILIFLWEILLDLENVFLQSQKDIAVHH